jgi:hypothetical protein
LSVVSSTVLAAEPSPSCATVTQTDNKFVISNGCSERISVAYGSDIECGRQNAPHNPYYRSMHGMSPGETWTRSRIAIRYAICSGDMDKHAWGGLKGYFESKPDGSFTCWPQGRNPNATKNNKPTLSSSGKTMMSTAAGTDLTETCERAKATANLSPQDPTPCNCNPLTKDGRKIPVYRCEVETAGEASNSGAYSDIKAHIREKAQQHCQANPQDCPKNKSVSIGVRD